MKTRSTIFKTFIITITVLITIIVFSFVMMSICAKGCSEAIKEDIKKSKTEGFKFGETKEEKAAKKLLTDFIGSYISTPTGEYKIINILEVPSGNPDRVGKLDVMVKYQREGFKYKLLILPKEEASPERIKKAILKNGERKNK